MKTKSLFIAILTAVLALSSCSKLLDIPRKAVVNFDTYYTTDDDIESAVAVMYLDVRDWYYNVMLVKNMLTDDHFPGGAAHGDNVDMDALGEFAFNSETPQIEGSFKNYYTLIYHANIIINRIDPKKSDVAARAVAEAHLFRGWAYFELATLWGNPPYVDHELDVDEYQMGNTEPSILWTKIVEDYKAALDSGMLPVKASQNDKTVWRVTQHYCHALLGKAYLWMATELKNDSYYQLAADELKIVVDSQLYDLFDEAAYGDIRNLAYKMNKESIFESVRVNDPARQVNFVDVWDNFDYYGAMVGWRNSGSEMTIPSEVSAGGWGFMVPTPDLLNAFEKYEGVDSYRRKETIKTYNELKAMGVQWNQETLSTGLFSWKGRFCSDEVSTYGMVNFKNPLWMRFAEVLLLGAEANLKANHPDVALQYVNRVRTRAQLAPLAAVDMDVIKTEKRLELTAEGTRFQDLVRWGDAYDLLKDKGDKYPKMTVNGEVRYEPTGRSVYGFKKGKHERLPYPFTETQLNKVIVQNPGY